MRHAKPALTSGTKMLPGARLVFCLTVRTSNDEPGPATSGRENQGSHQEKTGNYKYHRCRYSSSRSSKLWAKARIASNLLFCSWSFCAKGAGASTLHLARFAQHGLITVPVVGLSIDDLGLHHLDTGALRQGEGGKLLAAAGAKHLEGRPHLITRKAAQGFEPGALDGLRDVRQRVGVHQGAERVMEFTLRHWITLASSSA